MKISPITIIGAGPGGCTVALALSNFGIPCTLVDQSVFPRDKICGDALSGKVVHSLKKLNVELPSELGKLSTSLPSHGVSFYAPNGRALKVPFQKETDTEKPPGYLSKRMDFDNWIFQKAEASESVEVITGLRLEKFERENNGWLLSDKSGQTQIHTSLVIAADGAQSRFAKDVGGIRMEDEHYCAGLRAYYKNISGLDPQGFIELHFVKEFLPGYFWIFPLPNGDANVGVGMRSDIARKRKINLCFGVQ